MNYGKIELGGSLRGVLGIMTNLDLVDWTLREVRQTSPAHLAPGQPESTSSLNRLLEVLQREPSKPTSDDSTFRASAPSAAGTNDTPNARPASEFVADPDPKAVSILPVSSPTGVDVGGTPKSALLRAIVEPDAYATPIDRNRAIALRWVLRDINGNRLKWSPVNQHDMRDLIDMGLVEVRNELPVLTNKGVSAIV